MRFNTSGSGWKSGPIKINTIAIRIADIIETICVFPPALSCTELLLNEPPVVKQEKKEPNKFDAPYANNSWTELYLYLYFFENISTIAKFMANDIIEIVIVSTIISCIIHSGGIDGFGNPLGIIPTVLTSYLLSSFKK